MKQGDYVIYADKLALGRISNVTSGGIVISNYKDKSSALIPKTSINYILPCRFVPKEIDTWFDAGTDFARKRLTEADVEYVMNLVRLSACIALQRRVSHSLYKPPNGEMYKKALDSFTMMAEELYD